MVLEKTLRVPWTAKKSNQSILKEISPGISLEGMMLKLKVQYFGHLMQRVDSLEKSNAEDPSSIPGSGRSIAEGIGYPLEHSWASFVAQLVRKLPAMWETWVRSLG